MEGVATLDSSHYKKYLELQIAASPPCSIHQNNYRQTNTKNKHKHHHSSFKVCAECKVVSEMYNPELWPEGSVIRRYYEPRMKGSSALSVNAAVAAGSRATVTPSS